mmetsp:Transcript_26922/g.46401  ORF Transcript_26922/g.46401 Transcript_26922/m.46401 type:complete len:270 (-) Transcript_26922:157-966(-)
MKLLQEASLVVSGELAGDGLLPLGKGSPPALEGERDLFVFLLLLRHLLLCQFGRRVFANLLVALRVQVLDLVGLDAFLDVAREGLLILLRVGVLQQVHVLRHVLAEDVLAENLSVELLLLLAVAREASHAVRNVDATIAGALQGGEDLGTGAGASQADVKYGTEGLRAVVNRSYGVVLPGNLGVALVLVCETELLEAAACAKETGGVGGRVVSEAKAHAIAGQLVRVSRGNNEVTSDLGVDDLADHIFVCNADDEAVLRSVVLVLVLDN